MAVTTFHDFPLAPRDRRWGGAVAKKRIRARADAKDTPGANYRDAHIWYDADSKPSFTASKLLFANIVDGRHVGCPAPSSTRARPTLRVKRLPFTGPGKRARTVLWRLGRSRTRWRSTGRRWSILTSVRTSRRCGATLFKDKIEQLGC